MTERVGALRRLLLDFDAGDERERAYRGRMLELAECGERSLARTSYSPGHFTASAFVMSPDRQSLLLIYHSKLGLWLQPGGHIDANDKSAHAAAEREVREETGLECETALGRALFDIDIHSIPARGDVPEHEHFDVRFLLCAKHVRHRAGSDALSARWVPLAEVSAVQSDESVMRAARKLATATLPL